MKFKEYTKKTWKDMVEIFEDDPEAQWLYISAMRGPDNNDKITKHLFSCFLRADKFKANDIKDFLQLLKSFVLHSRITAEDIESSLIRMQIHFARHISAILYKYVFKFKDTEVGEIVKCLLNLFSLDSKTLGSSPKDVIKSSMERIFDIVFKDKHDFLKNQRKWD